MKTEKNGLSRSIHFPTQLDTRIPSSRKKQALDKKRRALPGKVKVTRDTKRGAKKRKEKRNI
jgi:hypothetical protein